MDGFVFLDKNVGFTSTSCGNRLKGIFHTKKIGHVGTLDPFATGLLIIGVNKGTKAITFFDDFTKEYVATIKLGVATDSMDLTGKEIDRKPVPALSYDKVKEVKSGFECGLLIEGFNDIKEGDIVEGYEMVEAE